MLSSSAPRSSQDRPAPSRRPAAGRSASAARRGGAGRGGLRVSRLERGEDDGYRSAIVPGVKSSADALRLAHELAFAAARLELLSLESARALPGGRAEAVTSRSGPGWRSWSPTWPRANPRTRLRASGRSGPTGPPARCPRSTTSRPDPGALTSRPGGGRPSRRTEPGPSAPAASRPRSPATRRGPRSAVSPGCSSAWPFPACTGTPATSCSFRSAGWGSMSCGAGTLAFGGENPVTHAAKRALGIGDPLLLERRAPGAGSGRRCAARGARPGPVQLGARRTGGGGRAHRPRAGWGDGRSRPRRPRPLMRRRAGAIAVLAVIAVVLAVASVPFAGARAASPVIICPLHVPLRTLSCTRGYRIWLPADAGTWGRRRKRSGRVLRLAADATPPPARWLRQAHCPGRRKLGGFRHASCPRRFARRLSRARWRSRVAAASASARRAPTHLAIAQPRNRRRPGGDHRPGARRTGRASRSCCGASCRAGGGSTACCGASAARAGATRSAAAPAAVDTNQRWYVTASGAFSRVITQRVRAQVTLGVLRDRRLRVLADVPRPRRPAPPRSASRDPAASANQWLADDRPAAPEPRLELRSHSRSFTGDGPVQLRAVLPADERNIASYSPTLTVTVLGGIHKIRHVVIIMQENRSFDHYFGTYPGADGIPPGVCVPDPTARRLRGAVPRPG